MKKIFIIASWFLFIVATDGHANGGIVCKEDGKSNKETQQTK
jgi:hypothetical protein